MMQEIIPKPDSIPFKPASIFVRLDPIEIAIGIEIKYNIPTLDGAAHINGTPAKNNRNNFSLDDKQQSLMNFGRYNFRIII